MTPRRLEPIAYLILTLAATGCAGNSPPTIEGLPAELSLAEGSRASLPFIVNDLDEDGVSLAVEGAHPGLEIGLAEDPLRLELRAGYGMEGVATVTVEATDTEGAATSASLTLSARPLRWAGVQQWTDADGPEAREHPAVIVDDARRRAIVIAGSGYTPYGELIEDAWVFGLDDGAWSRLEHEGELPIGLSRRAAVVDGTPTAYLFGGIDGAGQPSSALIRVDFGEERVRFTEVSQESPPPGRGLHAFVYDAAGYAFYAFGGFGGRVLSDVWRMTLAGDSARWEEVTPEAEGPDPRYGFFYAFDVSARRLLVYSGARGTAPIDPARDLWALAVDGAPRWERLLEGDALPPGRRNGTTVFDPEHQRMYVFGGTADGRTSEDGLHVIDLAPGMEASTQIDRPGAPDVRSSGAGWWDPVTGQSYLAFGNSSSAAYQDVAVFGLAP